MDLLVGTRDGLHVLGAGERTVLQGQPVNALGRSGDAFWGVVGHEGDEVWRDLLVSPVRPFAMGLRMNCVLPLDDRVFVGAAQATLLKADADGGFRTVEGFRRVEGRSEWYTPWGGPPDVRTLSAEPDGAIYANVHVGGIPISRDGGETWTPTIEADADVHQVLAHPSQPGRVLAATAWGFADSHDGGRTWEFVTDGLHASYSRAVALADDTLLLTASTGPRGRAQAAVYRRPLDGDNPFERCRDGLPEWFEGNVDSGCLDAQGEHAAFAAPDGSAWVSTDAGATWERAASGLPEPRCLALV